MSPPPTTDEQRIVTTAIITIVVIGVVGAGFAAFLSSWRAGLSVALGAAAAAGNLWLLGFLLNRWLHPGARVAPWAVVTLLKFGALIGLLYILVASGLAQPVPLILGFGALPLGIVAGQLRGPGAVREEG